jgi:ferritin-like metal-binding protein YciE
MKNSLKDIYYAEKQLVRALNKMSKAAESEELKNAFLNHRQETEEQVTQLEEAFEILGMRAAGKKCPAMDGLVEEGAEAIEEFEKGPARDAALIVSAQKVEHYEIAAYGSLRAFAETLGYADCAKIFDRILEQESNADEILNQAAQTINQMAAEEDMAEMEA